VVLTKRPKAWGSEKWGVMYSELKWSDNLGWNVCIITIFEWC